MRLSAFRVVCLCLFVSIFVPAALFGQTFSSVVIWSEPGLPLADSPIPSAAQLTQAFPEARLASTEQLSAQLSDPQIRLLILAQGSVVPEAAWSAIFSYLQRGGNLLVLGGRPFTRAAYHDATGWHLRDYSVRFSRLLLIDQYQTTPGSSGAQFTPNPDFPLDPPQFSWQQAYSPIIRLSTSNLYNRGGSAGSLDVRLDPLVWGVTENRRLSAPLIELDHFSSGFDGGRWIFLSAELPPNFFASPESAVLLRKLAVRAMQGAEEFSVRPTVPLYLPGEPVKLETIFNSESKPATPLTVQVSVYPEDQPSEKQTSTITLPANSATILPAPKSRGLFIVEARLLDGSTTRQIYHSAFWIRDEAYLRSGPRLSVNADYFQLDDKPLAIVGTTYMSSEVQRLYFDHPNVYVWSSDMALIHSAGLNMIRTGWWTGWDKFCDETGRPYDRTLRTLEAYLMTARKNGLPVQFTFFAFLPEVLGGANAYLDPQAVRKQQTLVGAVVGHFHDVPFLAWDLINEPSFSKQLWRMRPNGDSVELAAWNAWLSQKYPDRAALAAAWNVPPDAVAGTISLPSELEFDPRGMYAGTNSLRVYDYAEFAQDKFTGWVRGMREVIRATGSAQPITVGQDEGGFMDRLSPAFFAPHVDFTTNHTWWQDDHLLWDSLVAKQPGRAMLIQETGLQRQLNLDETSRLTPDQEASLFERKIALSFAQGSGAIEWLWNTNSYMTEGNEVPIGALHADATEKPEATVLRNFAKFAAAASPYLKNPKQPDIAVVTSQAAQFSVVGGLQLEAQQNAVRALGYDLHQPCYVIAESQIGNLGSPRLVILPSAQALRESTWQALLTYVKNGGNLLVTGPVSRNEHWHLVDRLTSLGLSGQTLPLTMHTATIVARSTDSKGVRTIDAIIPVSFDQQKQQLLEYLQLDQNSTFQETAVDRGELFWAAYPIELSEDSRSTAALYQSILDRVGTHPLLAPAQLFPGKREKRLAEEQPLKRTTTTSARIFSLFLNRQAILVYPLELQDAALYVVESESDRDVDIAFDDAITGIELKFRLPAQHAALALIDKHTKQIVAKYGF